MTEFSAPAPSLLDIEIAKIASPVERAAFSYFFGMTVKEGLDVLPNYTLDQFEGGIAPVLDAPVELADQFVHDTELVPNYDRQTVERNGLHGVTPLLEVFDGPFIRAIHEQRQKGAVRIVAGHPSLATPYVIARPLVAAYEAEYGEDIRPFIHTVVGAYPTVMKYRFETRDGKSHIASPIDFGRLISKLVLTAPRTANTETGDEAVNEWMNVTRAMFRVCNREIMSQPGNIMIVHPAGRRGKRSTARHAPFHHSEYRPGAGLNYITDVPAATFTVGVGDNLLNDPRHPSSLVRVLGDPHPYFPTKYRHVIELLERSAMLASTDTDIYELEGKAVKIVRVGREAVTHSSNPEG